jgi:hypothetical protein
MPSETQSVREPDQPCAFLRSFLAIVPRAQLLAKYFHLSSVRPWSEHRKRLLDHQQMALHDLYGFPFASLLKVAVWPRLLSATSSLLEQQMWRFFHTMAII